MVAETNIVAERSHSAHLDVNLDSLASEPSAAELLSKRITYILSLSNVFFGLPSVNVLICAWRKIVLGCSRMDFPLYAFQCLLKGQIVDFQVLQISKIACRLGMGKFVIFLSQPSTSYLFFAQGKIYLSSFATQHQHPTYASQSTKGILPLRSAPFAKTHIAFAKRFF